jgi:hypothetical protein
MDTELHGVGKLCDKMYRREKYKWTAWAPEDSGWKVIPSDSTAMFKIKINFLHFTGVLISPWHDLLPDVVGRKR